MNRADILARKTEYYMAERRRKRFKATAQRPSGMEAWDEVRSIGRLFGKMKVGGPARRWAIKTSGGELLGLEQ